MLLLYYLICISPTDVVANVMLAGLAICTRPITLIGVIFYINRQHLILCA